jgi:hypothetical protein
MFTHGSYVDVELGERTGRRDSEGGKADDNADGGENRRYDVRYVIGNLLSPKAKAYKTL